jgi:hypothetical protein
MMSILADRLDNQFLSGSRKCSPEEVVRHMVCMQSQDLTQAKRAIASRA